MPELPEVETVARSLKTLRGYQIVSVDDTMSLNLCRSIDKLPQVLGEVVEDVRRRGKWLQIEFAHYTLTCHLGMFGTWHVLSNSSSLVQHERLRLVLMNTPNELLTAVYSDMRSWGRLYVHRPLESDAFLAERLGVDALDVKSDQFAKLLSTDTRRVSAFFMDQSKVAGIGNIYRAEILHAASVHPERPCTDLTADEVQDLYMHMHVILSDAILSQGSSVRNYKHSDGSGSYQHLLKVYGQSDETCLRCQSKIEYSVMDDRKMYYCPGCQF